MTARRLALALVALAACGDAPPPAEPTELEARAETPDAPAPRAIVAAETGAVEGRVALDGAPPERRSIPVVRECEAHGDAILSDDVVVGQDGGLAGALVHVRRGLAGFAIPAPEGPLSAALDQRGCRYEPHVLAVRAGTTLKVSNSDALTHNVHVRAPRNGASINRSQAEGAPPIELALERAELSIAVACDLHPWMGAVVHVLDHPFFALTAEDGAFRIDGLPAGEYELEALHPTLGRARATVRVEPGGAARADLRLPAR